MVKDCKDCKLCRLNHLLILKCGVPKRTIKPLKSSAPPPPPKQPSSPPFAAMEQHNAPNPPSVDRTLRLVTMFTWIPAFSFLLPHAIEEEALFPALGLIPMTLSVFVGLVHVMGKARLRAANILADAFLAVFLIGMLIPSWILMAQGYCYRWCYDQGGLTMLGSYGSMMMMINFCIHTWFVVREVPIKQILGLHGHTHNLCPHCHGDLRTRAPPPASGMRRGDSHHSSSHEESYHFVRQDEPTKMEEGRISHDDDDDAVSRPSFHDETVDESAPLM